MKTRAIFALTAVAGLAAAANAQENVKFSIAYSSNTLNPGDIQHIAVIAEMQPGIGGAAVWNTNGGTGQTGTVYAFASAIWDIMNVLNGDTGVFSNAAVEPSLNAANIPAAAAGGNWNGVNDGQIVFPPIIPGDQRNPIPLFKIDWTPNNYTARSVAFNTRLNNANSLPQVFLSVGLSVPVGDNWSASFGANCFNIVPAPASMALLGLGGLVAGRRRR